MVMIIFLKEEKLSATKENDSREEEPGQWYAMETKRVLCKGRLLMVLNTAETLRKRRIFGQFGNL